MSDSQLHISRADSKAAADSLLRPDGSAVRLQLHPRCLWARAAWGARIVILPPARLRRLPGDDALDEVAEACWDAELVVAVGVGVLVAAGCGFARRRTVACRASHRAALRALGCTPSPGVLCRAGSLVTARSADALSACPEWHAAATGGAWLERLSKPAPAASDGSDAGELLVWARRVSERCTAAGGDA